MSKSVMAFPVLLTGCTATHWLELSPEFETSPDWSVSPLSPSWSDSCSVWATAGMVNPDASTTSARISGAKRRRRPDELRITNKRPPLFRFSPSHTAQDLAQRKVSPTKEYQVSLYGVNKKEEGGNVSTVILNLRELFVTFALQEAVFEVTVTEAMLREKGLRTGGDKERIDSLSKDYNRWPRRLP